MNTLKAVSGRLGRSMVSICKLKADKVIPGGLGGHLYLFPSNSSVEDLMLLLHTSSSK